MKSLMLAFAFLSFTIISITSCFADELSSSSFYGSREQVTAVIYVLNTSTSSVTVTNVKIFDSDGVAQQNTEDTCNGKRLASRKTCYIRANVYNTAAYSGSVMVNGSATKIRAVLEMRDDSHTINSQILR